MNSAARSVLDDVFVPRLGPAMTMWRSLTYLAAILVITGLTFAPQIRRHDRFVDDGHAKVSVSLAVNRAYCGARGLLSHDRQIGDMVVAHPELEARPIADILTEGWGSIPRYCATVTTPFMLSENSLMLTESWALSLVPGLSIGRLGRLLLAFRFAMIALLSLAVLRVGGTVLAALGMMQVGAVLLLQLQQTSNQSVYPFLFCMIVMMLGVYGVALDRRIMRNLLPFAVVAGWITAYVANMRTSYLPQLTSLFVCYMAAALFTWAPGLRRRRALWLAPVLFVAGYTAFQYWFIVRTRPPSNVAMSYHVIAHPLVLSLGQPPSQLANREGIVWNDALGLGIARRVDPTVEYLGPGYERALFRYYFGLWRKYPGEMIQIYVNKWREAGVIIVEYARFDSRWTEAVLTPWRRLPNGFCFLAIFIAGMLTGAVGYLRTRAPMFVLLTSISAVTALLTVEAATIMSSLSLQYHATLIFMCSALTLLGAQWVVPLTIVAAKAAFDHARPMGI